MRRTPTEDIEYIRGYMATYPAVNSRADRRYFYGGNMSTELQNILSSMGAGMAGTSVVADDETYLKALDILKIIIEEGGDE